ncbi:hypothetical protein L1987_22538 [Smallanthus sonchifolius]|uniref:Uncharacterized protein n=1 Tax=Smallanthus sonchifolius TaxID=185202 RepID=A0ACB9IFP2_9ASTR|nr:hypothetical protein L1987_22538 [Smallanthus sonchifolius]
MKVEAFVEMVESWKMEFWTWLPDLGMGVIMEKWRRKGDKCNQELTRTKFNYNHRKPSLGGNSNWHHNVPYWEKRFVSSVGSISWKKFLEAKEFTHLYDNIMKWDDYAGEEAFHTAKDRFYAQFHGLPCDLESHNPDLYNDKIDWNAQMDYNLIQDLESEPVAPDDANQHEPVVVFEDVLPDPYKDYSPYGWGDSDDMKKDQRGINWDDYIDNGKIMWDNCDVAGGNDWWIWNKDGNNGDQGWNTNSCDDNNYCDYSNVNNKRYM